MSMGNCWKEILVHRRLEEKDLNFSGEPYTSNSQNVVLKTINEPTMAGITNSKSFMSKFVNVSL